MVSHQVTMQVGKKEVKRLGRSKKRPRERLQAVTSVVGFLKKVMQEISRQVPEMKMDRAGSRFRKNQGARKSDKAIESCEVLLERLSIYKKNYVITSPLSPETAAVLSGVATIVSDWSPLSERDFLPSSEERDPDMDWTVSQRT